MLLLVKMVRSIAAVAAGTAGARVRPTRQFPRAARRQVAPGQPLLPRRASVKIRQ